MKRLLLTLPALLLTACVYDSHPYPVGYNVNVTPNHPYYSTNRYPAKQPNYNYQPYIRKAPPRYEEHYYYEHHDHGKHKGHHKHKHDD